MKSLQNRKAGGTFMIKAIRLAQKGLKQKQLHATIRPRTPKSSRFAKPAAD
jgi:hypothetical protein